MKRRVFLTGAVAGSAFTLASVWSLLKPASAMAITRSNAAFQSTSESEVLRNLFGSVSATPSEAVKIEMPLQAMYGKGAPIKVRCEMDGVDLIAILTRNNRCPLNSVLRLQGANAYYSTRIRVERNSTIVAYVMAGDSLYSATAEVKVSHGGYGTHIK